jgi:hypothetical protein
MTTRAVALPARMGNSPQDFQRLGLQKDRMEPWEDGAHTDGSPGTWEWWYMDAEFDGATLAIFMMTKPWVSHYLPLTPSVYVTLKLPDGSTIQKAATIPADEFSAAKDECDMRMGSNYFRGDLHTYHAHVEIDDFVADIHLTGTVRAWRPGTGYLFFGEHDEDFFATSQPVPLGDARVTVRGKDLDLKGNGPGYIDRGWTNVPQVKLLHDWYWARVQFGDYLVLATNVTAEKDYGYHEFRELLVTRGGQILANTQSDTDTGGITFTASDVHTDPDTGKPVANMISFDYQDGQTRYTVTFERDKTFLHIKFIDTMTGAELEKARAMNYDGALLRFTGTATFVHSEGDEIIYTQQKEAFWELAYYGHAR